MGTRYTATEECGHTDGSVELKGCALNKVDTTPYVGIHIDKYLSWNEHIDKTAALLNRKVGLIEAFNTTKSCFYFYIMLLFNHMYQMALKFGDVLIPHT